MLEWILIIAVLAAIFFAKDLPILKNRALDFCSFIVDKAKEKKDQIMASKNDEKKD